MNNEIISAIIRNIGKNKPIGCNPAFVPSETAEAEIQKLYEMSIDELRLKWQKLTGQPAPNWNKTFFIPRLAHKIQEVIYGQHLTNKDYREIFELAVISDTFATRPAAKPDCQKSSEFKPGQIIEIQTNDAVFDIVVLKSGFLFEDKQYQNLGSILRNISGGKITKQELLKCIKTN